MRRPDAKASMIGVAERLAAERGLGALSLRQVQELAGQANKSAARYHFGSRDGLIEAVIDARMKDADAARRELLDLIDARSDADPATLVKALVRPYLDVSIGTQGSHYARFLAQVLLDPALGRLVWHHYRAGSLREVHSRLIALCPLPRAVARTRVEHVLSLVTVTLAFAEGRGRDPDAVGAELTHAALALLALDRPQPG